jgi:hypothetical protein
MPGICWWYLFHKWVKSSFSTAPDIFKPLLKCSVFKCISWLNGSFFWGWTSGFSVRGSQDLSNGANVASQLAKKFFCLHIYSLSFKDIEYDTGRIRRSVVAFKLTGFVIGVACATRASARRPTWRPTRERTRERSRFGVEYVEGNFLRARLSRPTWGPTPAKGLTGELLFIVKFHWTFLIEGNGHTKNQHITWYLWLAIYDIYRLIICDTSIN